MPVVALRPDMELKPVVEPAVLLAGDAVVFPIPTPVVLKPMVTGGDPGMADRPVAPPTLVLLRKPRVVGGLIPLLKLSPVLIAGLNWLVLPLLKARAVPAGVVTPLTTLAFECDAFEPRKGTPPKPNGPVKPARPLLDGETEIPVAVVPTTGLLMAEAVAGVVTVAVTGAVAGRDVVADGTYGALVVTPGGVE